MPIELTRSGPSLKPGQKCQHNWTISVKATSTEEGLSSKIFVYQSVPEEHPIPGDTFSCVASLQQMSMIPEDAPTALPDEDSAYNNVPFYRTDTVTLDFHNMEQVKDFWKIVQIDAAALLREFRYSRKLKNAEHVVIQP